MEKVGRDYEWSDGGEYGYKEQHRGPLMDGTVPHLDCGSSYMEIHIS